MAIQTHTRLQKIMLDYTDLRERALKLTSGSNQVVRITESKLAAGCEKFQESIFLQGKVHIHPIPSNPGRV